MRSADDSKAAQEEMRVTEVELARAKSAGERVDVEILNSPRFFSSELPPAPRVFRVGEFRTWTQNVIINLLSSRKFL